MLTMQKMKLTLDREVQSLPQTFIVKTSDMKSLVEYLRPANIVRIEEISEVLDENAI